MITSISVIALVSMKTNESSELNSVFDHPVFLLLFFFPLLLTYVLHVLQKIGVKI